MKTILSTLTLLALSIFGYCQSKGNYTISGTLPGYQKKYIYLRKGPVEIDSTLVTNGAFSFKGSVSEPMQANIFDRAGQINAFILEPATYDLSGSEYKISTAKLSGGGPNEQDRLRVEAAKAPINNQKNALRAEYKVFYDKQDSAGMASVINKSKALSLKLDEINQEYILAHPDRFLSFFLVWEIYQFRGVELAQQLYQKLDPSVRNSAVGLRGKKAFDAEKPHDLGQMAVDFTQNDTNGRKVTLSSFRGKYVLLDFWASWCGPCRSENPKLVAAYKLYKDKGFEIIGVSLDNSKIAWNKAITDDQLPWIQVSDLKGQKNEVAVVYGVTAIPRNFLIDPAGKIIAIDLMGNELSNKLSTLLTK